jgi:hypothetical protein
VRVKLLADRQLVKQLLLAADLQPPIAVLVLDEPAIAARHTLPQRYAGPPAERLEPRNVEHLTRRAVRLARVEAQLSAEADHLAHDLRQLADRDVLTPADVEQLVAVVAVHQEQTGVGQVVDVQELATRRARAPYDRFALAALARFVELPNERGQHVRILQIEVVARPIQIGRHHRDRVEAVLPGVGLAQLHAGNLGDGIRLVGRLERAGQQGALRDRLWRELPSGG